MPAFLTYGYSPPLHTVLFLIILRVPIITGEGIVLSCYIFLVPAIGIMNRVFANGPVDLGSIPGQVIPKTQKWYLMLPCLTLSIIRFGSRVKRSNPRKEIATSPTPWCSSYRKGAFGSPSTMVANFAYFYIFSVYISRICIYEFSYILLLTCSHLLSLTCQLEGIFFFNSPYDIWSVTHHHFLGGSFQAHQLQLVSPSLLCFTVLQLSGMIKV